MEDASVASWIAAGQDHLTHLRYFAVQVRSGCLAR